MDYGTQHTLQFSSSEDHSHPWLLVGLKTATLSFAFVESYRFFFFKLLLYRSSRPFIARQTLFQGSSLIKMASRWRTGYLKGRQHNSSSSDDFPDLHITEIANTGISGIIPLGFAVSPILTVTQPDPASNFVDVVNVTGKRNIYKAGAGDSVLCLPTFWSRPRILDHHHLLYPQFHSVAGTSDLSNRFGPGE